MNDDPAITAVCNLIAALGMVMLGRQEYAAFRRLIDTFDQMNAGQIASGAALDQLNAATQMHRDILIAMGK